MSKAVRRCRLIQLISLCHNCVMELVVAGNPARVVCTVHELVKKRLQLIKDNPNE